MKRVYTNQEVERLFWAEREGLPSRLVVWAPEGGAEKRGAFSSLSELAARVPKAVDLEKMVTAFDPEITTTDITMAKLLSLVDQPTTRTVDDGVLRALATYAAPLTWGSFSYAEPRDLLSAFHTWEDGNRRDFERENGQRALIDSIEKKLRQLDRKRVIFEGLDSVASSTGFEPLYSETDTSHRAPVPTDAMIIFDGIVVSETLPFAQYRGDDGTFFYKVFKGRGPEELPNLEATILHSAPHDVPYLEVGIPSNTTIEPDTIYMTLWLGEGRMQEATKSSFHQVIYDLKENTLAVEAVIGGEAQDLAKVRDRLEKALPKLLLGPEKEVKVRGEFFITLDLDETVFYHLILNSWLANIFYAEESSRPAALKRSLTLNYRSLFYEELRLRSKKAGTPLPSAATVSLFPQANKPGTIKAIIRRTRNNDHLKDFLNIFSLALAYYLERKEEISNIYYSMLPELREIASLASKAPPEQGALEKAQAVLRAKKKTQRGVTRIKQLQEQFGKFTLGKGYARDCQGEHQPEIVPPEELEKARAETFIAKETVGGKIYKQEIPRQILPFPNAKNPEVHLICRSNKFPYPGLTPNKDEATKAEYPCIYCCYEKDQSTKQRYIDCMNMKAGPIRAANSFIISGKMLQERQYGSVPSDILQLLGAQGRKERPDRRAAFADRLNRFGVNRSPNSLLHCLLIAVGADSYNRAVTREAEERVTLALREELVRYLRQFPDLVRQELYDRTDKEILATLQDPTLFIDPLHYYRLLEEFFNVNIYIFSMEGKGDILVPRFKLFRAQSKQLRFNVMIIRNKGAESDKLAYPQCELIVSRQEGDERDIFAPLTLFDEEEAGYACYKALTEACRVFSFVPSIYPVPDLHSIPQYLVIPPPDVHALIPDYEDGTPYYFATPNTYIRPISQVVDSSGKLRALVFRLKDDSLFSIITIPAQPGALPRHKGPLPRIPVNKAIAALGLPVFYKASGMTEIDGVERKKVVGFGYHMADGMITNYVPVEVVPGDRRYRPGELVDQLRPDPAASQYAPAFDYDAIPEGSASNFLESEPDVPRAITSRIRRLKRTMTLILSLVRWLYELEKARGVDEPRLFVETFLRHIDLPVKDSADFYDFSRLRPNLPAAGSALEAIRLMSPVIPTLFTPEGFLLMYNQEMHRRMAAYIFDYHRSTFGLKGNPPLNLPDYYSQCEDFTRYPGVAVFRGTPMLVEWMKSLRVDYDIHEKLDFSLALTLSPSLYLAPGGREFYIIQSVTQRGQSGHSTGAFDLAAALYLAAAWDKSEVNLGAEVRPVSAQALTEEEVAAALSNYTVFKIGANGQLEEIKKVGQGRFRVLRFRTGKAREDENQMSLHYSEGAREQASFFAALLPVGETGME